MQLFRPDLLITVHHHSFWCPAPMPQINQHKSHLYSLSYSKRKCTTRWNFFLYSGKFIFYFWQIFILPRSSAEFLFRYINQRRIHWFTRFSRRPRPTFCIKSVCAKSHLKTKDPINELAFVWNELEETKVHCPGQRCGLMRTVGSCSSSLWFADSAGESFPVRCNML